MVFGHVWNGSHLDPEPNKSPCRSTWDWKWFCVGKEQRLYVMYVSCYLTPNESIIEFWDQTPTFRRTGQKGSIPDITLASESLASLIQSWHVIEVYNGSDH